MKNTTTPVAKPSTVKKYLITAAQRGAVVAQPALAGLENYAKLIGAQILILPVDGLHESDMLDPTLAKHTVVNGEFPLTTILNIPHFNVKPSSPNPLQNGIQRHVAGSKSAVIASPKQFMKLCANGLKELSKVMISTGAITQPHYRDKQSGNIAAKDQVQGALYVETKDKLYNVRFIGISDSGAIYDMGHVCTPKAKKLKPSSVDALVLGDWHTRSTCPLVRAATEKMIRDLKPKHLVIHDLFDGTSVNHHESQQRVKRAERFAAGELVLSTELQDCATELEFLKSCGSPTMQITVIKSNHDEFLDRYLDAGNYVNDPQNMVLCSQLVCDKAAGKDVLEEGIYHVTGKRISRVRFLQRDVDFKVRSWQLGAHGDLGANGSKATVVQLEAAYGKSITGHKHTPEVMRNVFVVGTSTKLDCGYNRGLSSWMNAHAIIQPNGKAQMILIIDGRYEF